MNFDEAVTYLLSLGHETLAMKLGLHNIERLLEKLGNPQQEFPAIQIAGTNGKGSTAAVLDSICRAANLKTALYTSPHLVSITERIKIAGKEITTDDFARLTAVVKRAGLELVTRGKLETLPTFFEHITAIALLAFREAQVELAILETGLGGRLDATTAASARTVALTPIAMDHQEYLGETLPEIASEKAAIIHRGAVVIVGPQPPEAMTVILRQCNAVGVKPRLVDEDSCIVGTSEDGRLRVTFETPRGRYENVLLGLRGRHQVMNVAVAIAVAETLTAPLEVPHEAIIKGIETATHPGRLEIQEASPRILFDGAHNPAAARALRDYLDEFTSAPITLIFGAMRDKNLNEMLATLVPAVAHVVLTTFGNPRAASVEMLTGAEPDYLSPEKITAADSPAHAWRDALARTPPDGIICVTGSLYLVGEIKKLL